MSDELLHSRVSLGRLQRQVRMKAQTGLKGADMNPVVSPDSLGNGCVVRSALPVLLIHPDLQLIPTAATLTTKHCAVLSASTKWPAKVRAETKEKLQKLPPASGRMCVYVSISSGFRTRILP